MELSELKKNIGKVAWIKAGCTDNWMWIKVSILGVRKAYGRVDYQISAVSGKGEAWFSADNVFNEIPQIIKSKKPRWIKTLNIALPIVFLGVILGSMVF